jgi:MarR family transcriptional regulator for hemolysin
MTAGGFERAFNEELAPHGITYRQCQVLFLLALKGDLTQTELAANMRIEAATLVGILDRMERDGWITRQTSATDRRKKLIRPTLRVRPVWKKITGCARRVRARATRGISPRDLQRVRDVLAALQNNLQSAEQLAEAAG